jgi:hypothetical protein
MNMRATVSLFVVAMIIGAQAGCEWYKNCGACVADAGCGWCSNDPAGVGSGSVASDTANGGRAFKSTDDRGYSSNITKIRSQTDSMNGVTPGWLVNVRGQYEEVTQTSGTSKTATLAANLDFEGTGYLASPYFGQTWGDAQRKRSLIGLHKTTFTKELKAGYTVTPYTKGTYTVASVQSDTQATMTSHWTSAFQNVEFQIGNVPCSGTISYPDTSKQDVYGSYSPNPTKFTTELKDGVTLSGDDLSGSGVRVKQITNDHHLLIDPRFTTSFANKKFKIAQGMRATGLISGAASNSRLEGSDPCRTSNNEPCYENTRFLTELRTNDVISINSNLTGTLQDRTVSVVHDNAHITLATPLSSMLFTTSKFKIKTFHASAYTYARKADGGLSFVGGTSKTLKVHNATTFSKNLMEGYSIVAKVPNVGWEKRIVKSIDSSTELTLDRPFSAAFGWGHGESPTKYNYESCPSLTYENFDMRTENGNGVITSDGTNHVYDNVQYSKITTKSATAAGNTAQAAEFVRHLQVGYTLTMDGITRTVTKIVDNTLLHINRAFKEGTTHTSYSYRYSVQKTGDFQVHSKPSTSKGQYLKMATSTDADIHAHQLMATTTSSGTAITKQAKYLTYPPVCYNAGRCVPKTSHSLVGVESTVESNAYVLSSALPHQAVVANYVRVPSTDAWFKDCKPACTVMIKSGTKYETRRVLSKINSTYFQTEQNFKNIPTSTSTAVQARVRYVTGTGTVHAQTGNVVTGASKETKTKFSSETSSGWTITIGCGGTTCTAAQTGGQTRNISSVSSDTKLTATAAFTTAWNKVDYTIGSIPGLGLVTASSNSKIVDGSTQTRFLEQLKVGYQITVSATSSGTPETRTITSISSNKMMTIDTAFDLSGIVAPASYRFSGKKGTGEVSTTVSSKDVLGTSDVTQTQFKNELALGYLFMVGNDYKVVTKITSDTILEVDTPFAKSNAEKYVSNDYNYESCWLSMGSEAKVESSSQDASYTNKKVYVEDACEIKPGCCGFKISSVVYPDRFAYYKIRPAHTNMNIRVVVKTTEDNVDLVVKKSAVPTTSSYAYKSVRESNPWALTIPQNVITCGAWAGTNHDMAPSNCDYWYIGVRGDNRYPQKTGASEYDLIVYTEFDFPNFLCSDAKSDQGKSKCRWLGISKNEDANMETNDDMQAVMRLTPNSNQRKGSMFYSNKVHLYKGFQTSFQFKMTGFSVGCNSVMYPSGFCGGGDGFAFVIQKHDDTQIGCTGSGLGYAKVLASKQGNDWARHRCTSVGSDKLSTCDNNDDGTFGELCGVGSLCTITGAKNGGCGTAGSCAFQSCTSAITSIVAIEFDTWNNLKLHDPKQGVSRWWINATEFVGYNDNHVAIFASDGSMESDHALNEHFAATPSIPNLADGRNHTVMIKYWPQLTDPGKEHDGVYNRTNKKLRGAIHTANIPTCGDCQDEKSGTKFATPDQCYPCERVNTRPGNLAIFVDDMKRPVLQTAMSLRKGSTQNCFDKDKDRCVLDAVGNAYIGFTAATGGERAGGRDNHNLHQTTTKNNPTSLENANKMLGAAQNHEILDWKFCNTIGCVEV